MSGITRGARLPLLLQMLFVLLVLGVFSCGGPSGPSWHTFGGDAARSGSSVESLPESMNEIWRYTAEFAPSPAWPPPARQDYWHVVKNITPALDFDRAPHSVSDGRLIFFGSSTDDCVHAVDLKNGREKWSYATEGPVRFAPVVADGCVYAGSDDGCVYCLDARKGKLVWKQRIAPRDLRLPGNERIISLWPVRTGIVVENGVVYATAGLFPSHGAYLCALEAGTGSMSWRTEIDISAQGYMALAFGRLIVPTGRTSPVMYDAKDGSRIGSLSGPGGWCAVSTGEGTLNAPGRGAGQIGLTPGPDKGSILQFAGRRIVTSEDRVYVAGGGTISAVDWVRYAEIATDMAALRDSLGVLEKKLVTRADSLAVDGLKEEIKQSTDDMKNCIVWKIDCGNDNSLLVAGDRLYAGGEETVAVINTVDGAIIGDFAVLGTAYSLASAGERLIVSTDRGVIHAFGASGGGDVREAGPKRRKASNTNTGTRLIDAAERIIGETGIHRGWCLDVAPHSGRLAQEIARISELRVIVCAKTEKDALRLRKKIGLNPRVIVHVANTDSLPYRSRLFNLVISEETVMKGYLPENPGEISRVLRPDGGTVYVGNSKGLDDEDQSRWSTSGNWTASISVSDGEGSWFSFTRLPEQGAGEWRHLYADTANTSSSADSLRAPLFLQWYGRPGPRGMVDRHHRTSSPLVADGRCIIPGNEHIYAVDAYNGTPLWETDLPGARRVGALKDSGNMMLVDDKLYAIAGDSCHVFDVGSGVMKNGYRVPGSLEIPRDWGWMSASGDLILGTAQLPGASFADLDFRGSKFNASYLLEEDFREVISSDYVFAFKRDSGDEAWKYDGGTVLNATAAVTNGRIYFVETTNPAIARDEDGRVRIDHVLKSNARIVALNAESGGYLWTTPVDLPFQHIIFLSVADGLVLVTGTYNVGDTVYYGMYAYHERDGREKWRTRFVATNIRGNGPSSTGGSHGEQWQHPVIESGTIFLRPYAFDLATGKKKEYIAYRGGHGCGGLTGSAFYLYGRGSTPRQYPTYVTETEGIQLTHVSRPGCWLNMIPAGGLVLIPESSSGCTCPYAVQTSMAFAPGD